MNRIESFRVAGALALVAVLATPLAAFAQLSPPAKGTPKLQPRPSETSGIPSGQDAGTPATSNSAPLGTAVLPSTAADRDGVKRESAAARAAARRRVPAATAPASAAAGAAVKPVDAAASAAARP